MAERPVCPMCGELGIHPTVDQCLEVLRAELDRLRKRRPVSVEPSARYLGRWVPSFWP